MILRNAYAKDISQLTIKSEAEFRTAIVSAMRAEGNLHALFCSPAKDGNLQIFAVLSSGIDSTMEIHSAILNLREWTSVVSDIPAAHLFEREIAESWGVQVTNHPELKPVRYPQYSLAGQKNENTLPGVTNFYSIDSTQTHEVAVGPVHAGIIEPGHFRFQCHGELVYNLEIALGYQHRGIERALVKGPSLRSMHLMETAAGDTTIGHALAYCQALEGLSDAVLSPRAHALRTIALELERLANHTGDLGALAMDVGFLPTASYCGRIRGDFLNMTALLCGNRFGRGLIRPGGVAFDLDNARAGELLTRLEAAFRDVKQAVDLLFSTSSVISRFEDTGCITAETAKSIGLVGPSARASGRTCDIRQDFPFSMYQYVHVPVSTWHTGDVFARAYVRWLEIEHSFACVKDLLTSLPSGALRSEVPSINKDHVVVSLVEGWRGEICHIVSTNNNGQFAFYKMVDPSFHNWTGLALALRNQQISDFPLCNKSFNLSYCGHDL